MAITTSRTFEIKMGATFEKKQQQPKQESLKKIHHQYNSWATHFKTCTYDAEKDLKKKM